ncbi:serine/threonine protein kinase [Parafrankia soli]|uniref:non-specific serine/threonine protein kinase n=1 Tax=Parafrankia soli TaxID=2599596 RepID=A0A1S1Q4J0_9ACTN|nr:serine/threonine-protein kinase [Parafrankia soli]OHV28401.1 serine/threonine protein kinase [Parafrankia soli]
MTVDGIACPEPDCDGIIEDGYCNVTGLAYRPPEPDPGPPPHPDPTGPGTSGPGTGGSGTGGSGTGGSGGSGSAGGSASWSLTAGGTPRRRRRPGRARRPQSRLGEGLVDVPDMPTPDPESLLLTDPCVPEHRRVCSACGAEVGRARDGRPAAVEGFCVTCGHQFSFVPALRAGDRVGSYEIAGALAHGGQGWVYLARNREVADNFWVVLKGLLDKDDPDAQAAAIAERRFLAAVDDPAIVRIHTFVRHAGTGYIVMEYVGGTSLREVLRQRRAEGGRPDPLPVTQAIAYILAVLPAFAYLHRNGLVFCDFKPDNVMLGRESLRLIDLGAVRRLDDESGASYRTRGYSAPEVETETPTVASDLYTVGRTLATLILNFRGNTTTYVHSLPPASTHEVLARHESLDLFLRRATAWLPEDRFVSADEMRDELLGVLREILAAERGAPVPAPSRRFTGDVHLTGEDADGSVVRPRWASLPRLRVDPEDPAAGTLAALPDSSPAQLATLLAAISPATVEVRLRLARAHLENGDTAAAAAVLDEIEAEDPFEWRVRWYRGLLALGGDGDGDTAAAAAAFTDVYAQVPGELAPKLALAVTAEAAGDQARAATLFDLVSRTDDGFTSAAFGLARVRVATKDRAGAVAAYERVPPSSAAYQEARIRTALVRGTRTAAGVPRPADLVAASGILAGLDVDRRRRVALTRDLLRCALDLLLAGDTPPDPDVEVAGTRLREDDLRFGLERAYRELATLARSAQERYDLVDLANAVRPRTRR